MKALLITTPLERGVPRDSGELATLPNLAIVNLVSWMRKAGYTDEEWDFYDIHMLDPSDEEIRQYFRENPADILGVSAVLSQAYVNTKKIVQIFKEENPNAWVVVGGSMTASTKVLLHQTVTDICVLGEGEYPWVDLCNYVKANGNVWNYEALSKIKGLSYLNADGEMEFTGYASRIPLDEYTFPDYDILKVGLNDQPELLKNYFVDGRATGWTGSDPRAREPGRRPLMALVPSTKGCVARCTFCQRAIKGYGVLDVGNFEKHLIMLKERFNVGFINILDENWGSNRNLSIEQAKIFHKHDMLWFTGGVRCKSMQPGDVKFYKDHGCTALKFGIESGSQKILDMMEKNFTVEDVKNALDQCYQNGMYSPLSLLVGMPGETNETVIQSGKFVGDRARAQGGSSPLDTHYGAFYAMPIPGTPLFEYAVQTGMIGPTIRDEELYLESICDRGTTVRTYVNLTGQSLKTILHWRTLMRYAATREFFKDYSLKDILFQRIQKTTKDLGYNALKIEVQTEEDMKLIKELEAKKGGNKKTVFINEQKASPLYKFLNSQALVPLRPILKFVLYVLRRIKMVFVRLKDPKDFTYRIYRKVVFFIPDLDETLADSALVSKLIPATPLYWTMRNLVYYHHLMIRSARWIAKNIFGVQFIRENLYDLPRRKVAPLSDDEMKTRENRYHRSLRKVVSDLRNTSESLSDKNQQLIREGR